MKINNQVHIGRLIGKIDNDFNLDESDWIPRVAAWTIDALSQMGLSPVEEKVIELEVTNGFATLPCDVDIKDIKLYDNCGNEINKLTKNNCCGYVIQGRTIDVNNILDNIKVKTLTSHQPNGIFYKENNNINNIEINQTNIIKAKVKKIATYHDEYYDCDVPYIYDDGLLLEALAYYCLFKYLSRGSHHPVYDLKSNSPVTNPYLRWNDLRPKAKASVLNSLNDANNAAWRSMFYNFTFTPRD